MKHFDNLKMVLFDSSNANFRLAVEVQFTRTGSDGNLRDLVYTTDKGSAVLNPNIYLTFCYKDDQMTSVYTSYPQLYKIRRAFKQIKDALESGEAFIKDPNDQSLSVKQSYAAPIILDNIGKKNNWIQLKLEAVETGENGVCTSAPGVGITLSTANGWVSLLSEEEFYTVYTIIKDLNLSTIQCIASLGFLNADPRMMTTGYNSGYYPQQQNFYTTPGNFGGGNPAQTQQPMNGNWSNRNQGNYQRPSYNNQPRQSYRTTAPAAAQPNSDTQAQAHQPAPQPTVMRDANKPIMNPKAVEDTPVSQYDIDDAAAIDSIFNS